jgi:hypothetical protein
MGRPIMTRPVPVRGRTLAGGAVLGGLLLLALALLGGVGETPSGSGSPDPERLGPVTAVQPELREALLTDQDLATAPAPSATTTDPPAGVPAVVVTSAPAAAGAPPAAPAAPATSAVAELCRALFEDPAGLSGLWRDGPWRAAPPQETSSRQTARDGGATLHQLLGVFAAGRSAEAYRQLREQAAGCDRFQSTLPDGSPVTVLLQELSPDRRESRHAGGADDGYAMTVTVRGEERTLTGWLSLDRLGPVVSVLRHLEPVDHADHPTEEFAETRLAALGKLRPLLAELRGTR